MEFKTAVKVQNLPVYRYVPSKSIQDIILQKHMGFCLPGTPKYFTDPEVQYGCHLILFKKKLFNKKILSQKIAISI